MDCRLPDFSVHGIFQARVLEWVAIAFSEVVWLCHNLFTQLLLYLPSYYYYLFSQQLKKYWYVKAFDTKIIVIILQSFCQDSCLLAPLSGLEVEAGIWARESFASSGRTGPVISGVLAFLRSGSLLAFLWGAWTHGFLLCHRNLPPYWLYNKGRAGWHMWVPGKASNLVLWADKQYEALSTDIC